MLLQLRMSAGEGIKRLAYGRCRYGHGSLLGSELPKRRRNVNLHACISLLRIWSLEGAGNGSGAGGRRSTTLGPHLGRLVFKPLVFFSRTAEKKRVVLLAHSCLDARDHVRAA